MPKNIDDIESHVMLVRHDTQTVQLDLMDGKYVPEKTWPFFKPGSIPTNFLKEEILLPFWEEMNYELDLMVERPEEHLDIWFHIGASRIIFHASSVHDWNPIKNIESGIRNFIEIGVAVTLYDKLEDIYALIDEGCIDFVQVMGIRQVGFQGNPFEEKALSVISTLRSKYPEVIISVDGGVSLDTLSDLKKAGASRFVSGSGVFLNGIPSENINSLYEQIY